MKFHTEELQNLYISPDIVRGIRGRRLKWARHEARMGEGGALKILTSKPKEEKLWKSCA